MRNRVVARIAAAPFDEPVEVAHHLQHGLARPGNPALPVGARRDDRLGPAVEAGAVFVRDAEVVRDHHRGQRLEELRDDVPAAGVAQPLDALDDELADLWFHRLDLARSEPARHQFAELGVRRGILHHHRRVVGQADEFELAVGDGQPAGGGERLVVAGGGPHVGMPGKHPVILTGSLRLEVVHRVVLAQGGVHGPGVCPGGPGSQLEPRMRQIGRHVSFWGWLVGAVNQRACVQCGKSASKPQRVHARGERIRPARRGSGSRRDPGRP